MVRTAADPTSRWDVLVIGGGITGLATAWDAVSRGLKVALVEQDDFAKSTSSRSTKLVHGGVRYLQKGEIGLVREALHERARLLHNAPEFTRPLRFVLPTCRPLARYYYRFGMWLYDMLAGKAGIEKARLLSRAEAREKLPGLCLKDLTGGVSYSDAQFDDAALAIAIAQAIESSGGTVLNYASVTALLSEGGEFIGAAVRDVETDQRWEMRAKVLVNATGIFSNVLRDDNGVPARWTVRTSRGSHLVCDRAALPGDHALIIPKTRDGRVLFAIPWKQHVVVGTTDVPTDGPVLDPVPDGDEIGFILEEAGRALGITATDVTSQWSGLRPLVSRARVNSTAAMSRKHIIESSPRGLISVLGGKWTTSRRMGEDAIDAAVERHGLRAPGSTTADRPLTAHGARPPVPNLLDEPVELEPGQLAARVKEACRHGYARRLEDVLTRRLRLLQLDARRAIGLAPEVAQLMANELGWTDSEKQAQLDAFIPTAESYAPSAIRG